MEEVRNDEGDQSKLAYSKPILKFTKPAKLSLKLKERQSAKIGAVLLD
jgi:hypothetical protein